MTIQRPVRSPQLQITIPFSGSEMSPAQIHTRQLILKSHESAPTPSSNNNKRTMSKARFLRQSPRAQSLGLSPRSTGSSDSTIKSYRQLWSTESSGSGTPLRSDSDKENTLPKATTEKHQEKKRVTMNIPMTPQAFLLSQLSKRTDISYIGNQRMVSRTENKSSAMSSSSSANSASTTTTSMIARKKMRKPFQAVNDPFVTNNKLSANAQERTPLTQFTSHTTATLPKDFSLTLPHQATSSSHNNPAAPKLTSQPPKKDLSKEEQQAMMDRLRKSPRLRSKTFLVKMACRSAKVNTASIINDREHSEKISREETHPKAKNFVVAEKEAADTSVLAPRQWTHEQLSAWLTMRLESLWKRNSKKTKNCHSQREAARTTVPKLPVHVHGRAMMRMTKVQIANVLHVDPETAEYIYTRLRSETDRADRMALKQRVALKKIQGNE